MEIVIEQEKGNILKMTIMIYKLLNDMIPRHVEHLKPLSDRVDSVLKDIDSRCLHPMSDTWMHCWLQLLTPATARQQRWPSTYKMCMEFLSPDFRSHLGQSHEIIYKF